MKVEGPGARPLHRRSPEDAPDASPGFREAPLFFAASVFAFAALLFGGVDREGRVDVAIASAPYAVAIASSVGLALVVALAALHGLERVVRARFSLLSSSGALVLGAIPFVAPIAAELASGDGAARVLPAKGGAFLMGLAIELGLLAVWGWHRVLVREASSRRGRRRIALSLGAIGLVSAALAFSLTRAGLEAYAFLVDVVALAFTTIAATLLFVALARSRPMRRALMAGWAIAAALALVRVAGSPTALAEGREVLVSTSQVAARVDRLLWPAPQGFSLRMAPAARVRCEEPRVLSAPEPFPLAGSGPRNVLLISVDALRSDAVHWEREKRPLMPNLARFLAGSVRTQGAVSTYPATIFAVGGALSGLRPSRMLFAPSPPRTVLSRVAERVDVASAHVPSVSWFETRATKKLLLEGLRARHHENASDQVRAVIAELRAARAAGSSYAVWTHFYEPHHPYRTWEGFEFGRSIRDRYASELAYLDASMGALFDYLERSGAYRDTLVVFFADHGEALGERRYNGHHVYLDGFITDVPFGVRAPGLEARTIESVVELTDVAATVADFFGLAQEPGSAGESVLRGDPPPDRAAISEAFPIRGMDLFEIASKPVRGLEALDARMERVHARARRYSPKVALATRDFRLIVDRESGLRALYRRGSPSSRQANVASQERIELARLTARLERWHEETAKAIRCGFRRAPGERRAMAASTR